MTIVRTSSFAMECQHNLPNRYVVCWRLRQITTCDLMEVNLSMQFQTFLDFWWCHLVFVDSSALALDTMVFLSCNALVANKSRK